MLYIETRKQIQLICIKNLKIFHFIYGPHSLNYNAMQS